ncbi:MAG: RdgB/HAM1 family non-canonical purine NTP pyrophosphatase [Paludibacteraceae bacterium]
MQLVFASNNPHKLEEVRAILGEEIEVLSLQDVGFTQEIDETGETLEENSLLKAKTVWRFLSERRDWSIDGVFADDTGLEIKALGMKPGVHTARWAADECAKRGFDLAEVENNASRCNRRLALESLKGEKNRTAQFRTVITYIQANGLMRQVEGIVKGNIAREERGEKGFGYDSIFIPSGYTHTFAELPSDVKNSISHRARAVQALRNILLSERK